MTRGVILYGPPAAGKDTIDAALRAMSDDYVHFARIKVGEGCRVGYRMTTSAALRDLRERGAVVWENSRYGATYVVDQPGLVAALGRGVPVLHLGQVEAVNAVVSSVADARWTVVALWCPAEVAADRLERRGSGDVDARLAAWRATERLERADIRIDTSVVQPGEAARLIDARARANV
ncbi:hypothetical protein ACFVJS_19365 [Nocardioides sp. NPDC057772]|uniref:phosphotransferase-like protein n=1 Tax=Nocardioides sp. NPDC057772 TaxID=3346245 RepID=UPI00366C8DAF